MNIYDKYKNIAEQITNNEITLKEAADKESICTSTLRKQMRKLNIDYKCSNNVKCLTKEDLEKALQMYNSGMSLKKTSKHFNMSGFTLSKNFKRNNIDIKQLNRYGKHKNFDCNKDIFSDIDSEEKAYWLGFLLADGYISKDSWHLELALKKEDYDHLVKFKNFLNANIEIRYKAKTKSYSLSITSKKICTDLIKHGVVNNKSLTCIMNEHIISNEKLKWHYFRGFIEGDGSVTVDKKKYAHLSLTSNCILLTQLTDKLPEYYKNMKPIKDKRSNAYHISLGNNKTISILKKCYLNCHIYLDRKYKKAIAVLRGNSSILAE